MFFQHAGVGFRLHRLFAALFCAVMLPGAVWM
jgi:hypothetical protein